LTLPAINGPTAALIAGAITSIHCVGMCGPLACYLTSGNQSTTSAWKAATVYHLGRVIAYTALGALAGGIGSQLTEWVPALAGNWLPWAFILFFILLILGLEKSLQPSHQLTGRVLQSLQARAARLNPLARSALVGLGTPLLPCGPLYLVLGVSLVAGSALSGGLIMLCFSLGTIGLLFILQVNVPFLEHRLTPRGMRIIQRSLAAITVAIMVWRAAAGEPMFSPSPGCPMCPGS